ncbi:hypothetical protein MKK75_07610 [Methylobacterium sp. J-030]|uniref:hypothetical protein n=1 Tax=Methylobacterium sp. J-030 TaxID=2836627 RepID=UPI001FBAC073|nr:hypothetical protein [Methylobacterium sp. J-030]MCJ2068668.1 hypothetical protein [Methylobacterium sp. J-030]
MRFGIRCFLRGEWAALIIYNGNQRIQLSAGNRVWWCKPAAASAWKIAPYPAAGISFEDYDEAEQIAKTLFNA